MLLESVLGYNGISKPAVTDLKKYNTTSTFLDMWNARSDPFGQVPESTRFTVYDNVVYGRTFTHPDYPNQVALQYWFFYPYNEFPGDRHEGDWEMVTIVLNLEPKEVEIAKYAQHMTGTKYYIEQLEFSDNHPKVFLGKGSHASYANNQGGDHVFFLGLFHDYTSDQGITLTPSNYEIINVTGVPSWIQWLGHWGDSTPFTVDSPGSGAHGVKWTNPLQWVGAPRESVISVKTNCPVHLHAYDQYGNHTGLNDSGEIEAEIPGTYLYYPSDGDEEYIVIATEEEIRFEIKATNSGDFDFSVWKQTASDETLVNYESVAITANSTANLTISSSNPNYIMNVDLDGDGTTDEQVSGNMSPTVITNSPSNITSNSATFSGNLTSLGTASSANVSFEWGLTSEYGANTTVQVKTGTGLFTANISGLSANTSYHYRAKAEGDGTIYGSDQRFTTSISDTIPPAAVDDLTVDYATRNSLRLVWTPPGDDNVTGTAAQYDIRYSTSSIDNENDWNAAANVTGEPSPLIAGSSQNMTVIGLTAGTTYYFALKTADEVPNWSNISNIASKETIPFSETLRPMGSTNETSIDTQYPGSGYHWQKVCEVTPDEDSGYLENKNGPVYGFQRDLFAIQNHTIGSGGILTVRVSARFLLNTPDYPLIAIRTHGAVYTQAVFGNRSEWLTESYDWTVNPYTGAPWTWDEVDALEAGVSLPGSTYGPDWSRATQVYVVVNPPTDFETLRPDGNVTGEINFPLQDPTSGAHWDKVDDTTADEGGSVIYINGSLGSPYYRDLFTTANHSGSGYIGGVTVYARIWQIYYPTYAYIYIKVGDNVSESSQIEISSGYPYYPFTTYSNTWMTNPNTGCDWTWDDIDALQIGVRQNSWWYGYDNWGTVKTTQVYAVVSYWSSGGSESKMVVLPETQKGDKSLPITGDNTTPKLLVPGGTQEIKYPPYTDNRSK
jgi:hypothetical protein